MSPVELTDHQIDEVIREIEDTLVPDVPTWRTPVEVRGFCDGCGAMTIVILGTGRWLCGACILKVSAAGERP